MASTDSKTKSKKKPQDRKGPTAPGSWARSTGGKEEVTLPSGNVALVKRPGPLAILRSGLMPDSLMPIINEAIKKGQGLKIEEHLDATDEKMLLELMDGMDKSMLEIVIEPAVMYHMRPKDDESGQWESIPDEERDLEKFVYTDEIDLQDKMFLFNFAVGGTRDLERFRKEHSARVGDVADNSGDGDSA